MTLTPRSLLRKIRTAGDYYAISLEADLEGQALNGPPTVRILDWRTAEDMSADFPDLDPSYQELSVGGETQRCIRFWLAPAIAAAQPPGRYAVEALFETTEGRKPAGVDRRGNLPQLIVSDV